MKVPTQQSNLPFDFATNGVNVGCPGEVTENNNDPRIEPCGTPDVTNTLCDANVVYVRRNAAFILHLGHVTGDMKQHESNETQRLTSCMHARKCN